METLISRGSMLAANSNRFTPLARRSSPFFAQSRVHSRPSPCVGRKRSSSWGSRTPSCAFRDPQT